MCPSSQDSVPGKTMLMWSKRNVKVSSPTVWSKVRYTWIDASSRTLFVEHLAEAFSSTDIRIRYFMVGLSRGVEGGAICVIFGVQFHDDGHFCLVSKLYFDVVFDTVSDLPKWLHYKKTFDHFLELCVFAVVTKSDPKNKPDGASWVVVYMVTHLVGP